jgi:hypothetical protein
MSLYTTFQSLLDKKQGREEERSFLHEKGGKAFKLAAKLRAQRKIDKIMLHMKMQRAKNIPKVQAMQFPKVGAFYFVLSMVAQHDDGSTPLMILPDGLKYPLSNKRTCVGEIQTGISVSVVDTHLIFDY